MLLFQVWYLVAYIFIAGNAQIYHTSFSDLAGLWLLWSFCSCDSTLPKFRSWRFCLLWLLEYGTDAELLQE